MEVRIVEFPETRVAAVEHRGPPLLEQETAARLIAWRIANRLAPGEHASYGVHYTDPSAVAPEDHRVDFCVAYAPEVEPNPQGVVSRTIPAGRCAVARCSLPAKRSGESSGILCQPGESGHVYRRAWCCADIQCGDRVDVQRLDAVSHDGHRTRHELVNAYPL